MMRRYRLSGLHRYDALVGFYGATGELMRAPSFEIEECATATHGLKPCMDGQIFFDCVDQFGNSDRLGEKWMPLDAKAGLCLSFCD
jgi:hypothetical protein